MTIEGQQQGALATLYFDTETTGLVDFSCGVDDPAQPHVVQLAALLEDVDGNEVASMSVIVRPGGWTIPEKAAAVHGITQDKAERCGVPIEAALRTFDGMAGCARRLVAHNIDFDAMVLATAYARSWPGEHLAPRPTFGHTDFERYCTMKAATPICRILHARPRHPRDWKWPKLSEAYAHFFGEKLEGAHDALVDLRACRRLYHHLRSLEDARLPIAAREGAAA